MPLQSEQFEYADWHQELRDAGCALWDSCLNCVLPVCAEDIGRGKARALASQVGIITLRRNAPEPTYITPSAEDYRESCERYYAMGLNANRVAEEYGIPYTYVRKIYDALPGPNPGLVPPHEWTKTLWEASQARS